MKKIFLMLLFLSSMLCLTQEISYDYIIEKETIVGEKHTSFQFYNSKTHQFFSVQKISQKFIGSLYDAENKLLHYFYIFEKEGKYNAIYSDSYIHNSNVKGDDTNNLFSIQDNIVITKLTIYIII
ncbi:hypothetical protein [Chryseobacterium sp.]|uniref:hypothetical protein n=1 Tax=Chryseobacterium sp. TaxID=1871047 RepID=UPI0028A2D111|nr:hypothetical protein [Chryseobacterium sp.]